MELLATIRGLREPHPYLYVQRINLLNIPFAVHSDIKKMAQKASGTELNMPRTPRSRTHTKSAWKSNAMKRPEYKIKQALGLECSKRGKKMGDVLQKDPVTWLGTHMDKDPGAFHE